MKDEDKGSLDLTLLLEEHKKEIWAYKQKESQWVATQNQLDGNKQIINELSTKLIQTVKINLELKKKLSEAEGEASLVKAVGINSPEMKSLKQINEDHQKLNGDLQMSLTNLEQENIEIHADNIKLSRQIEDLLTKLKKSER
jgi:myosin heavy subunit